MATDDDTSSSLHSYFSPHNPLEPDVLSELQSIMRLHEVSAEDLFYKWESYCIKLDTEAGQVSLPAVRNFKAGLQDELERTNQAKAKAAATTERRVGATPRGVMKGAGDVYNMLDSLVPGTPAATRPTRAGGSIKKKPFETPSVNRVRNVIPSSSPAAKTPTRPEGAPAPASFNDRPNAGEIIEVLGDHHKPSSPPPEPYPEARIKLNALSDAKALAYKPLAMKLSEAAHILDERIDALMHRLHATLGIAYTEFGSAADKDTVEVVAVGRIASDAPEGKLNPASLVLETSRQMGTGLRAPLNMSRVAGGYSVFPGQIVALRGSNPTGTEFVVTQILEVPLCKSAASTPRAIEEHRRRLRGNPEAMDADAMDTDDEPRPLNIMFASGPYTPDDNLHFEALHELCSKAASTRADALILTGPFLDSEHPLLATGDFDLPEDANYDPDTATLTTVFRLLITPAISALVDANPSITIILIPSVRDMLSKHVSWPQDRLPRADLGLPRSVKMLPNPMTLFVNEVILGVSSQDVLYELRSEELVVGEARTGEHAPRLSRHLVEQRHFFPLFPPADRSRLPQTGAGDGKAPGAVLDTMYLKLGEFGDVRPDVLLLPSALQPFARVVERVLVINPGYLSKRRGAGTYARMTLYPRVLRPEEAGAELVTHNVFDRARVEVVKI